MTSVEIQLDTTVLQNAGYVLPRPDFHANCISNPSNLAITEVDSEASLHTTNTGLLITYVAKMGSTPVHFTKGTQLFCCQLL